SLPDELMREGPRAQEALALRLGRRLVTEDAKSSSAAPALTQSLAKRWREAELRSSTSVECAMNPQHLFSELKRRNVYKVAVAYIVGGWALSQGIAQVLPVFDIPNWIVRLLVVLIIIGFPTAVACAWAFEITPEGLKRTEDVDPATPHRIHGPWIYIVLVGAAVSISLFFLGRYTAPNRTASSDGNKSIAVLPFATLSDDRNDTYFADGVQDQILTNLAKVSDLKVISHTSV